MKVVVSIDDRRTSGSDLDVNGHGRSDDGRSKVLMGISRRE